MDYKTAQERKTRYEYTNVQDTYLKCSLALLEKLYSINDSALSGGGPAPILRNADLARLGSGLALFKIFRDAPGHMVKSGHATSAQRLEFGTSGLCKFRGSNSPWTIRNPET